MSTDRPAAPLLAVKQHIPLVRTGAVRRHRLESRLRTADTRLILVVGPAGWGKTTLLSSWANSVAAEVRLAWVSLDEGDNDPIRFWRYAIGALTDASTAISQAPLGALLAAGVGPLDLAIPLLLNELTATTTPHALVLDDFHLISNAEVHEQLEYLLAYLPPTIRLVLASRQDPPLPIARLRARGQLTEIRADDLRFDRTESDSMLAALVGGRVQEAVVSAVWTRTEGWAAGLQLAGLALRTRARTSGRPELGMDDRHLVDYFASEVLPALTDEEHDLLLRSAPLDRLSGTLCDTALNRTGSGALLDRLDRESLFVVALDSERIWFRCHHLFRQALLGEARLAGTDQSDVTDAVLTRAAQWFADHDLFDEAVRCLLRAGNGARAARLLDLESVQNWFLDRGLAATFLGLAEALPEPSVSPQLALGLVYAAEVCGRRERISHWLDVAEARLSQSSRVGPWRDGRAAVLMMRGLVGTEEADSERAVRLIQQAVDLERAAGTEQPWNALPALGAALSRDGRFEEAAALLQEVWQHGSQPDWSSPVPLQIAGLLGFSLVQSGRLDELDQLLREAGPLADRAEREWGPAAVPLVMLLRIAEGRRLYLAGAADDAREVLARVLMQADAPVRASTLVPGLVFLADAELACGDRVAARETLSRACDVAAEESLPAYAIELLENAETRVGRRAASDARHSGVLFEELTDRELAILRTLPGSATQREIGAALYLSINTIKAYNKNLYRKLGVNSRQEAVTVARQLGLI